MACGNRNKGTGPPTRPIGSPQCHDVTQRTLQRVAIVADRDTNIDLGPTDNTAQVSQNTSLPKVLARISNVWVYVGDNDIVIL